MKTFIASVLLVQLSNAQVLLSAYPPLDQIPPTQADIVASVPWQTATPATTITQCTDKNAWGLTYDDGPSASTPLILDFLKKNNIKATFFVVGSRITEQPAILKRAYAEGHQIGIHTWSHMNISAHTPQDLIMELKWSIKIINDTIGVVPRYFRPPCY